MGEWFYDQNVWLYYFFSVPKEVLSASLDTIFTMLQQYVINLTLEIQTAQFIDR